MKHQMLTLAVLILLLSGLIGCGRLYIVRVNGSDNVFTTMPSVTAPTGSQSFDGTVDFPLGGILGASTSDEKAPIRLVADEKIPEKQENTNSLNGLLSRLAESNLSNEDKAIWIAILKKTTAGKTGSLVPTVIVIKKDTKHYWPKGTKPIEE